MTDRFSVLWTTVDIISHLENKILIVLHLQMQLVAANSTDMSLWGMAQHAAVNWPHWELYTKPAGPQIYGNLACHDGSLSQLHSVTRKLFTVQHEAGN